VIFTGAVFNEICTRRWKHARKSTQTIDPLEDFDPREVKRVKDFISKNAERVEIFKFLIEQYR
jgi:hypothetical protein